MCFIATFALAMGLGSHSNMRASTFGALLGRIALRRLPGQSFSLARVEMKHGILLSIFSWTSPARQIVGFVAVRFRSSAG
jgi:hypothetical protein